MENVVVVFTKNNARVLKNPPDMAAMLKHRMAILNPDLSLVERIPPHFWKMAGGMVVPMSQDEQLERLDELKNGVDNTVITPFVIDADPVPTLKQEREDLKTSLSDLRKAHDSATVEHIKRETELRQECVHAWNEHRRALEDARERKASLDVHQAIAKRTEFSLKLVSLIAALLFILTLGVLIYGAHGK